VSHAALLLSAPTYLDWDRVRYFRPLSLGEGLRPSATRREPCTRHVRATAFKRFIVPVSHDRESRAVCQQGAPGVAAAASGKARDLVGP